MNPNKLLMPTFKHSSLLLRKTFKYRNSILYYAFRKSSSETHVQETVFPDRIHLSKPTPVKWKRPPFLKNFFCGKFDTELLAFPEILDKDQVHELEDNIKLVSNIVRPQASPALIKSESTKKDYFSELKSLGLFGRMIPEKYGGLGLSHTANTRINEVMGLDWSLCGMLAAHEFFASEVLLKFGSEEQKSHYLPKLASGDIIGAYCCSELESGSDLLSMGTTASQSSSESFVINGSKSWVTNANIAGLFIVFAKTPSILDPNDEEISVFLVDRNTKGVNVTAQNKVCLHGLDTGMVHFDSVVVPSSNLIGNLGQGFQIYLKALESFRINLNSFTFGTLKSLLDSVTDQIIHRERVGKSAADYQLIRTRLSKINSMVYGMESAAYFTSAILDSTENPDIDFESAALKLFNSRGTQYCLNEFMEVVGSSSLFAGSNIEVFLRDALGLSMFDAPNDIVRLYLGLSGCKYVGEKEKEKIFQLRNRFYFPKRAISENFRRMKIRSNRIYFENDIAGHIHPSLVEYGNKLETYLLKFEVAIYDLLEEHGKLVSETQIMPKKFADIAAELYVWSAVLSRCSRSYCIGLKNSHHELRMACAFSHDCDFRLQCLFVEVLNGMNDNNEANHLLLGGQVVDCQGYFAEHPLKHNF